MTKKLDTSGAATVAFPLRGEWVAVTTPAKRVPSHGTDYFGQRYALDFARVDGNGQKFSVASVWRHLFGVIRAEEFLAWGAPVLAAFGGRVIKAGDGWPDRQKVNALWEAFRATVLARGPQETDYRPLVGNFVLVEGDVGVALYAHLRRDSVRVREGDSLNVGEELGRVGNSGNSTMPHLHFQLMNRGDPLTAAGRLCLFTGYERQSVDGWEAVDRGIPGPMERVRAVQQAVEADEAIR